MWRAVRGTVERITNSGEGGQVVGEELEGEEHAACVAFITAAKVESPEAFPSAGPAQIIWSSTHQREGEFGWRMVDGRRACADRAPARPPVIGERCVAPYGTELRPYLWDAVVRSYDPETANVDLDFDDGDSCSAAWDACRLPPLADPRGPPQDGESVIAPICRYSHNDRTGFVRYMRGTLLGRPARSEYDQLLSRTEEVEALRSLFIRRAMEHHPYEPWLREASAWLDEERGHARDEDEEGHEPPQSSRSGPGPISDELYSRARALLETHFPSHLCCPISMAPMREPVVAADGHTYDRTNIARWQRANQGERVRSPVTNEVLASNELFPNNMARSAIHQALEALVLVGRDEDEASSPVGSGRPPSQPVRFEDASVQTVEAAPAARREPRLARQASVPLQAKLPRQYSAPADVFAASAVKTEGPSPGMVQVS